MVRREYSSIVFVDNLPLQITTAKLGSFWSNIWLFFNVSFTPIFFQQALCQLCRVGVLFVRKCVQISVSVTYLPREGRGEPRTVCAIPLPLLLHFLSASNFT